MNKVSKVFLTIIFTAVFSSFVQTKVHAESINNYNVDATINLDGTVTITEKIEYDFGNLLKHGIYRNIPLSKTNIDGKKFVIKIGVLGVTDSKAQQFTYDFQTSNNTATIKIGDADKLVTGKVSYIIKYKVSGALTYFSDHDEFYWNATGLDWNLPISKASVNINLPKEINKNIDAKCYTGPKNSTLTNCTFSIINNQISFASTKSFNPNEGLTVVVKYPKGVVSVLEPDVDYSPVIVAVVLITIFVFALIWYVLVPSWLLIKYLKERTNIKTARIVAAWFEPPKNKDGTLFTPAQTTFLTERNLNIKLLVATLISLAQKGYLKIKELDNKQFSFNLTKDFVNNPDLSEHERIVLEALFKSGGVGESSITTKQLKGDLTFYKKVSSFYKVLAKSLWENSSFLDEPYGKVTLNKALLAGGGTTLNLFLAGVTGFLGKYAARTSSVGIEKYGEAKSLKNFLESQSEQLNFQAKNQMFFEKLLPYATAYGLEKVWAKRFADIKIINPEWFEGNDFQGSISRGILTNSIYNTMNGAVVSATRSSSGFSSGFSGGSSGGGGGGGGGGSW